MPYRLEYLKVAILKRKVNAFLEMMKTEKHQLLLGVNVTRSQFLTFFLGAQVASSSKAVR